MEVIPSSPQTKEIERFNSQNDIFMISSPIIFNQNESKFMSDEKSITIEDNNEIKIIEELVSINNNNNDEIKYFQDFIDSYLKKFKLTTHFPILKLDLASILLEQSHPQKQQCFEIKDKNGKLDDEDETNKIKTTKNIWIVAVDSLFSYFKPVVNYVNFNNVNDERFGLRPISELILRVNHFNFF